MIILCTSIRAMNIRISMCATHGMWQVRVQGDSYLIARCIRIHITKFKTVAAQSRGGSLGSDNVACRFPSLGADGPHITRRGGGMCTGTNNS